jgi:ATP-dependent Clp protease ATP-binding subunit ClpC
MLRRVFDGFTKEACDAVTLAQEEAAQLGRRYVGAEHMLLGLLHGEDGVAFEVLTSLGITFDGVRGRLLKLVPPDAEQEPAGCAWTGTVHSTWATGA